MSEIKSMLRGFWSKLTQFGQWFSDHMTAIEAKVKVFLGKSWKFISILLLPITWPLSLIGKIWKKGCWGKLFVVFVIMSGCAFLCSHSLALVFQLAYPPLPSFSLANLQNEAGNIAATIQGVVLTPTDTPTPHPFEQLSCAPVEIEVTDASAQFFESPGRDNKVLFIAQEGEEFLSIGRVALPDGSVWIQVEIDNGFAWVFALAVSRHGCQLESSFPLATPAG